MTASGYMTAAVAVNRYIDISAGATSTNRLNGYLQAFLVLFASTCINIPRWLEFKYDHIVEIKNATDLETGEMTTVNVTRVQAFATNVRQSDSYIRDYTLISATILIVILPTLIMLVRYVSRRLGRHRRRKKDNYIFKDLTVITISFPVVQHALGKVISSFVTPVYSRLSAYLYNLLFLLHDC